MQIRIVNDEVLLKLTTEERQQLLTVLMKLAEQNPDIESVIEFVEKSQIIPNDDLKVKFPLGEN